MRLGQKEMGQRNSGVEIFVNKVGATQIKFVLAPCHSQIDGQIESQTDR